MPKAMDSTASAGLEGTRSLDNSDALPPAMVFQCANCRTIVGDSFSWLMAQRELSAIILHKVTENVCQSAPPVNEDNASYSYLLCNSCNEPLGRRYHTTPPELYHLFNKFALCLDAIIVYVWTVRV